MVNKPPLKEPVTPIGNPATVAPVPPPPIVYTILAIGVLIQTVCPSVPGGDVSWIVASWFTVTITLPVMSPVIAVQFASDKLVTRYVVVAVGDTGTISGLEDVITGVPPLMLYVNGAVPVNVMLRLVLLPLQMVVVVPLITDVGCALTVSVPAA